jgi:nicotinamidase-related amidase
MNNNRTFRCMAVGILAATIAMSSVVARAQTVIDEWAAAKAPPPPQLKEVTIDPTKTALLIIDYNKKLCTPADRPRCAAVLPKIEKFLAEARSKGMLVIHIYNIIMTPADLAVTPAPGERVMQASLNKFHGTDLEKSLKDKGITTVVITGTSANGAVLFTVAGAAMLGLKVIAPVDGMPADGVYQEQFVVWELANAPTVSGASTLTKWDMIKF